MTDEETAIYAKEAALTKAYQDALQGCLTDLAKIGAPRPADDTVLGIYLSLFTEKDARLTVTFITQH